MGKFEGGISLIPCSFFQYCPGFQISVKSQEEEEEEEKDNIGS